MARRKITEGEKPDFSDLPDLTDQQRKFVFLTESEGRNASDAYRLAYDCSNSLPESVWTNASKLFHDAKVTQWRSAIKRAMLTRAVMSKEEWIKKLLADAEEAKAAGNHGANMQALKYIGDALGFTGERLDITVSDPAAALREIATISPEVAAALAKANDITWN